MHQAGGDRSAGGRRPDGDGRRGRLTVALADPQLARVALAASGLDASALRPTGAIVAVCFAIAALEGYDLQTLGVAAPRPPGRPPRAGRLAKLRIYASGAVTAVTHARERLL
jgi:hypothetical protein